MNSSPLGTCHAGIANEMSQSAFGKKENVHSLIVFLSLKAQLQRMFAFQHPLVGADDIVVMTDVDAFLIDPRLFEGLEDPKEGLGYRVWVYQYFVLGEKFVGTPMCFVAMSKVIMFQLSLFLSKQATLKYDLLQTAFAVKLG